MKVILAISKNSPKALFSVGTGSLHPSALAPLCPPPPRQSALLPYPLNTTQDFESRAWPPTRILSLNPPELRLYCQVWAKLHWKLDDLGEEVRHRVTDHWYSKWLHRVAPWGPNTSLACFPVPAASSRATPILCLAHNISTSRTPLDVSMLNYLRPHLYLAQRKDRVLSSLWFIVCFPGLHAHFI